MTEATGVSLREVTPDDVDVFFHHQSDAEASAMAAFPSRTREAHDAHWERILADPLLVAKAIVHEGITVGNIGSWMQDGHREIGYWIGREHWGKGIATRAVSLLVELVSERPLLAYIAEHNLGSIRVLEKCGFIITDDRPEPEPGGVRYVVMELR